MARDEVGGLPRVDHLGPLPDHLTPRGGRQRVQDRLGTQDGRTLPVDLPETQEVAGEAPERRQ